MPRLPPAVPSAVPASHPPVPPAPDLASLLDRAPEQRKREYQYRFAQSLVFGLPVFALEGFGRSLGGLEADRWVAVLEALLAGWVLYVGAAGMLFEGVLRLRRRQITADLLPATVAALLYVATVARVAFHVIGARGGRIMVHPDRTFPDLWFHWAVAVLILWTGLRWWRSSHNAAV